MILGRVYYPGAKKSIEAGWALRLFLLYKSFPADAGTPTLVTGGGTPALARIGWAGGQLGGIIMLSRSPQRRRQAREDEVMERRHPFLNSAAHAAPGGCGTFA